MTVCHLSDSAGYNKCCARNWSNTKTYEKVRKREVGVYFNIVSKARAFAPK